MINESIFLMFHIDFRIIFWQHESPLIKRKSCKLLLQFKPEVLWASSQMLPTAYGEKENVFFYKKKWMLFFLL